MLSTVLLVLIPIALAAAALSGVLSAVETALLSVSRGALEKAAGGRPAAVRDRVLAQYGDGARTLASVSLGRMLAEVVMVAAVTGIALLVWERFALPGPRFLPLLAAVLLAAVMVLVVLAISPRTIGGRRPESVLLSARLPVAAVRVLLWPAAGALTRLGESRDARPGHGDGPEERAEKARQSVDRALEDEHVRADERDMIQGVFDLRGTMVRELMVPRTDMVTIPAAASAEKALRLFVRSGFSRIPVYAESIDDLCGMLYVKDVLRAIHSPWDPRPGRPVREIMRAARFAPEFVAADDVLRQMQTSHVHITVLVDEYGGVAGIVTIEDILEEIVGEIADEHDPAVPEIEQLDDGRFRVPARAGLSEVGELFDLEIDDDDIDSVGGLLGKVTGRVPIPGSRATAYGLDLEAERTAGRRRRLSTVLVGRAPQEDEHAGPPTDQEDER
ncbi:hemolysin family protein [Brachybacterium sp. YJGR34]|uniref:hemolysin family protein n=1 Tax=Brachybacterium sp. YJGR34 TaxID=2059911 RepID=UPI000E0BBCFB|nr:hemolysin family protein [Brachybacterium sp. YJGR34]